MSKSHQRAVELLAEKIHLSGTHRWWLYGLSLGLAFTGIVWLIIDFATLDDKTPSIFKLMALLMKFHGLFMLLILIVIGSLITNHIRRAWYLRIHLKSGLLLCALLFVQLFSGYWLYYWVNEDNKEWISMTHWIAGLLSIVVLLVHIYSKRKRAK